MINPACTPGWVEGRRPSVTAHCGCGWTETGFPSRSAAKRAQRVHRFPPVTFERSLERYYDGTDLPTTVPGAVFIQPGGPRDH